MHIVTQKCLRTWLSKLSRNRVESMKLGFIQVQDDRALSKTIKVSSSQKEILASSILPKNKIENSNFCPSLRTRAEIFCLFFGRIENTKKTIPN